MVCEYGYEKDINNCDICKCYETVPQYDNCRVKRQLCDNIYACPKVEEVTHCCLGGVDDYTTYRLSIVLNDNVNIKNLYALFGDTTNEVGYTFNIPPAYQGDSVFNSNIGEFHQN